MFFFFFFLPRPPPFSQRRNISLKSFLPWPLVDEEEKGPLIFADLNLMPVAEFILIFTFIIIFQFFWLALYFG